MLIEDEDDDFAYVFAAAKPAGLIEATNDTQRDKWKEVIQNTEQNFCLQTLHVAVGVTYDDQHGRGRVLAAT